MGSKTKPKLTLPGWDLDDKDSLWFVVACNNSGSTDFAYVSRDYDGNTPVNAWTAMRITHNGGFDYESTRTFGSLQEAKDWVELTYALES